MTFSYAVKAGISGNDDAMNIKYGSTGLLLLAVHKFMGKGATRTTDTAQSL
jgi:hypothetical protein